MILSDIEFPLNGLTVVTDTLELNSLWLLKSFVNESSLIVSFREPSDGIDLSATLFTPTSGNFAFVNLDDLAKQIRAKSPQRLVLEHPDILVSSGIVSPAALLDWIEALAAPQLIISVCVNPSLLEAYPVSKSASKLVISLLHSASQQIKVEPLSTGYSSEFNGTIEIIAEKNQTFLFQIEKDSVRVHRR